MVRGECGAEKKDTQSLPATMTYLFQGAAGKRNPKGFQRTTHTKTNIIRTLGHASKCVLATVFDWFNQYKTSQEAHRRGGLEYATEDRTNLTLRKDLNCFGKPNARPRR